MDSILVAVNVDGNFWRLAAASPRNVVFLLPLPYPLHATHMIMQKKNGI
jgi:hypothetical protein